MTTFSPFSGKSAVANSPWKVQVAYVVIGALFLGYIVVRALHVGAVYDEVEMAILGYFNK